ncbi:MAG TPA: FlgD immunoglobulin-like domain containing protein [Stellaceae bacterium]|nr:FlgD immunoglobulin-like domain containing protein [Stellaceae bacterium]
MSVSSAMPATVVSLPSADKLPTSSSGVSAANATLNENDFFTLMTTQLENQDPLNPMSSTDFAAELAQFSTANGVQNLETTMTSLGTQLGTTGGIQAANLVGKSVGVSGNSLVLGQSGTAAGAFNLPSSAQDVVVTVSDAAGNAIGQFDLGAMAAGTQSFTWNGQESDGSTASAGAYQFSVSATNAAGAAITAAPLTVVPVTGVALGGTNGPMLDLGNGLAPVALSSVQQIF